MLKISSPPFFIELQEIWRDNIIFKVTDIPRSDLLSMSYGIFDNHKIDLYQERTKTFTQILKEKFE